jgi:hypothetical protein
MKILMNTIVAVRDAIKKANSKRPSVFLSETLLDELSSSSTYYKFGKT